MKILKFGIIAIAILMLIGWIWKGVKLLLFLSLLLGGLYLVYQLFFAKDEADEAEAV